MSSRGKAEQDVPERPPDAAVDAGSGGKTRPPKINKIDITSLRVDESYDGEHDPYNSTGQHLVDAMKERFSE